jgi:hypothetical protein
VAELLDAIQGLKLVSRLFCPPPLPSPRTTPPYSIFSTRGLLNSPAMLQAGYWVPPLDDDAAMVLAPLDEEEVPDGPPLCMSAPLLWWWCYWPG